MLSNRSPTDALSLALQLSKVSHHASHVLQQRVQPPPRAFQLSEQHSSGIAKGGVGSDGVSVDLGAGQGKETFSGTNSGGSGSLRMCQNS